MPLRTVLPTLVLVLLSIVSAVTSPARAAVPVRVSVKFVLDAQGNRGTASGNFVLDQDVYDHVDRANEILGGLLSELEVELVEIVDLAGVENHHGDDVADALAEILNNAVLLHQINPLLPDRRAEYAWRDDAINVYVVGDNDSAGVTYMPSRNHIVVMGQAPNATTLAHEIGHDLNLKHTFESGGDGCSDTLVDRDPGSQPGNVWGVDQIASENFGMLFAQLTASQSQQVVEVFRDLMSYHDSNNRDFLSRCQMDRNSAQGWSDRGWMLGRRPVYVSPTAAAGGNSGSWSNPYASLDEAVSGGTLDDRVMVLLAGAHGLAGPLTAAALEVIPRRGAATIHEDVAIWTDPPEIARSASPAVAAAARDLQAADRAGDADAAIEALLRAEAAAEGDERLVVRLKLAQRLRHAGRLDEALVRYRSVAEEATGSEAAAFAAHWAGRVERSSARPSVGAPGARALAGAPRAHDGEDGPGDGASRPVVAADRDSDGPSSIPARPDVGEHDAPGVRFASTGPQRREPSVAVRDAVALRAVPSAADAKPSRRTGLTVACGAAVAAWAGWLAARRRRKR